MNQRDRLESFTVHAARVKIKKDKTIRAAVIESPTTPMVDDPKCRVRLFDKVGEAEAFFRARRDALLGDGWQHTYGTLGRGLLGFETGNRDDSRYISLDKRRN